MKIIIKEGEFKKLVVRKIESGMLPQIKKCCTDYTGGSRTATWAHLEGAKVVAEMCPDVKYNIMAVHQDRNIFFFSLQHKTEEQWTLELENLKIKTARTIMVRMVADRINAIRKSLPTYKTRFGKLAMYRMDVTICPTLSLSEQSFDKYELPSFTTRETAQSHYQAMVATLGINVFRNDLKDLNKIIARDDIDDTVWEEAWGLAVAGEILES